jgi:hypothetical protein
VVSTTDPSCQPIFSFFFTLSSFVHLVLPAALGPGAYSASNRNEYQKHKNNVSGE